MKNQFIKVFFVFFVFALNIFVCQHVQAAPDLTNDDIDIIQEIYDKNQLNFEESFIEVKICDKNEVLLSIKGNIEDKSVPSNEYQKKEEFLYLPIALFEKTPQSYTIDESSSIGDLSLDIEDKRYVQLLTYKVKDGLWDVVAVVSIPEDQRKSLEFNKKSVSVNLNIAIRSPSLKNGLYFIHPIKKENMPVDFIVTLPDFYEIDNNKQINKEKVSNKIFSYVSISLPSLSGTLDSRESQMWDFSTVTYHKITNKSMGWINNKGFS